MPRTVALDAGLIPLRDEALAAVAAGAIALDELRTLLPPERLAPQLRSRPDLFENAGVNGQPRSAA